MKQVESPSSKQTQNPLQTNQHAPENFAPTLAMTFIIGVMAVVICFVLVDRDPDTIVIDPNGDPTEVFNATTALDYADRISRIAEVTVGGVLTLTLALVGFSWLSTSVRIDRDRQELVEHKQRLQDDLEHRFEKSTESYEGDIIALKAAIGRLESEVKTNHARYLNSLEHMLSRQNQPAETQFPKTLNRGYPDISDLADARDNVLLAIERKDDLLAWNSFADFVGKLSTAIAGFAHSDKFARRQHIHGDNLEGPTQLHASNALVELLSVSTVMEPMKEFVSRVPMTLSLERGRDCAVELGQVLGVLEEQAASAPPLQEVRYQPIAMALDSLILTLESRLYARPT